MTAAFRDALSRSDSFLSSAGRSLSTARSSGSLRDELQESQRQTKQESTSTSTSTSDHDHRPRARKPSPGLAARLKALGFGKDAKSENRSSSNDRIGRIPEDQIHQLDQQHRLNSLTTGNLQSRGRAWEGTTGYLTPQKTGGSYTDITIGDSREFDVRPRPPSSVASFEVKVTTPEQAADMHSHKYRLPDHTNSNGTKAKTETKMAHIEREIPPDDEIPPPPISKDSPPGGSTPNEFGGDVSSYFNPFSKQRAGSIYTLSRVSFANQLAQLTSLQLPDAGSLSTKVSAIPTSKAASKALLGAAEQIRSWISKASEVISGLDGEDDVEWAAAGGREGLEEVDNAITRFEELINVYVSAIESLQARPDYDTVAPDEQKVIVAQVETIIREWGRVKTTLKDVKNSVEFAMDWEEIWNTVLGDIGMEMDILARLVFEMEEKRHKTLLNEGSDGIDINELETIVEETPSKTKSQPNNRFSVVIGPAFPLSPNSPSQPAMAQDDSNLLALFARMQPLRASLDFLPMRLQAFHTKAEDIFPTGCEEIESRREELEKRWKDLEKDAQSLRSELGEDRWILVFRGAGRQAQKMYESVERSVVKLQEGVDSGAHLENPASMGKKIESYEAKKMHYGPAIERVLSIIQNGVKDRVTVNGEILRLHSDMQQKWEDLKEQMHDLDATLEDLHNDKKNQQLRDSVSSMLSNDRSTVGSLYDTPGSSPASSVVMANNLSGGLDPKSSGNNGKGRPGAKSTLPLPGGKRTTSTSQLPRQGLTSRISSLSSSGPGLSPSGSRQGSSTPTGNRLPRPTPPPKSDGKPRWNSSTKTHDLVVGHAGVAPLTATTPSPSTRSKPPSAHVNRANLSIDSKIPLRSPLSRDNTSSPVVGDSTPSRKSNSRLGYHTKITTPGPYSQQVLANSTPARPRALHTQSSMSALNTNRRVSYQPKASDPMANSPASKTPRSASSLASHGRMSLLPQPGGRLDSSVTSRESSHAVAGALSAMRNANGSGTSVESKGKAKKPFRP